MLTGKVIAGKVLIKPLFEDVKTSSGIILQTTNNTTTNVGIVIKVGNTTTDSVITEGCKVMFDEHHSKELTIEGNTYHLVYYNDIQYIY